MRKGIEKRQLKSQAVTTGSFAVPPLAAEAMYNSGVHFVGERHEESLTG